MPLNYSLTLSKIFAQHNLLVRRLSLLSLTTHHKNFIKKQWCQKKNLERRNIFYSSTNLSLAMYIKKILLLSLTLLTLLLLNNDVACAQFTYSGQSRFMNFGPKSTRDIAISVIKNISEDTSIREVLLNFKAEDKSLPNYNLT